MALHCPHCQHALNLKAPKSGRYTPKCPKCQQAILITVPADPQAAMTVAALPAAALSLAASVSGQTAATGSEQPSRPAPQSTQVPPRKGASERLDSPGATAEFRPAVDKRSALQLQPCRAAKPVVRVRPLPPEGHRELASPADRTAEFKAAPPVKSTNGAGGAASSSTAADRTAVHVAGKTSGNDSADFALGSQDSAAAGTSRTGAPRSAAAAGERHAGFTLPMRLGGYELVKELGRGGMGEVYLARQISLDRHVAVKTMRPEWASDPIFVARFTREAFAAAQLVHHNVVQIHDFGAQSETNFFSMEFVEGSTLAQLVGPNAKLDPQVAVGYMVQAARGLAMAHEKGMVHRDIKPDNLLLNRQGIIKIADLGIVKKAGVESGGPAKKSAGADPGATQDGVGLGTPAFMPPEQATDAASVDPRADIYSLGCTLYVLVTGRPPFEGRTSLEIITKHATEPVVPPDTIVKEVPKSLSDIILRMVAKKPQDRYQNMQEVIRALEGYLGTDSTRPFSPREEHLQQIDAAVAAYQSLGLAKARPRLILGFFAACLLGALLSGVLGGAAWALSFGALAMLTPLVHFLLTGLLDETHLFARVRALAVSSRWKDHLAWGAAGLIGLAIAYALGLLGVGLGVGLGSLTIAAGFFFFVDRTLAKARRTSLDQIEQLLRRLRLESLEEDSLRQFVAKYGGRNWEELYEALFGYDAKLLARERWSTGAGGLARPKFAAWRDPLVRYIDARLQARLMHQQQAHLIKVEQNGLQASGLSAQEARCKALEATAALMLKANKKLSQRSTAYDDASGWGPIRLVLGGALAACCLMWMYQNNMLPFQKFQQLAAKLGSAAGLNSAQTGAGEAVPTQADGPTQAEGGDDPIAAASAKLRTPVILPLVPQSVSIYLGNFFVGSAGLILVFSALLRRWYAIAFSLVALFVFCGQFVAPKASAGQLTRAEAQAICTAEQDKLGQLLGQRDKLVADFTAAREIALQTIQTLEANAQHMTPQGETKSISKYAGAARLELQEKEERQAAELKQVEAAITAHQVRLAAAKKARDEARSRDPGP